MLSSIITGTAAARYKILQKTMADKGYKFFTKGDYNLNIVGYRTLDRNADSFNDYMFVTYLINGFIYFHIWPITTDPGLYWLRKPSRLEGTAILVPGQYRGVYRIDKHRGKYYALCQRNGSVKVYRDANKDIILDMLPETIQKGSFGINIHKAGRFSKYVGRWSAGCQVFQKTNDFNVFMNICKEARDRWKNKFTYTLLEQE